MATYELGHQPLALAATAAWLKQAGFAPRVRDLSVETFDPEDLADASLVLISIPMHTATRLALPVIDRIRLEKPEVRIGLFGLYAGADADHLLGAGADFVVAGESEPALVAAAEALAKGDPWPDIVTTAGHTAAPLLERLAPPRPDRSGLPGLEQYAGLRRADGSVVPAGYVETTRGCLHTCLHCPVTPVYQGRFFIVPRDTVLADIAQQVEAGAEHITFGDPDFLNGPGHGLAIVRAMHERWPGVSFDITTRIEHILEFPDAVRELAALGCAFILSAAESLSNTVLERLDKGHTAADVVVALRLADDAGVPLRLSLVPFTPWTTLEDLVDLVDFVANEGLVGQVDPVHFSIRLLVPPGSALLGASEDLPEWLGPLEPDRFGYQWIHADERVDALQRRLAAIAEAASGSGSDPAEVFGAIRREVYRAAGREPAPVDPRWRPEPPRLTEDWFC